MRTDELKIKLIYNLFMIIILGIFLIHGFQGANILNNYYPQETNEIKTVNEFVRKNITSSSVMSNDPPLTYLRTGISSIAFPPDDVIQEDFEKLIDHFDISYLIFYNLSVYTDPTFQLDKIGKTDFYKLTKNWMEQKYVYEDFQTIENSHIVKINPILSVDSSITNPSLHIRKSMVLEENTRTSEAKKIIDEIKSYKMENDLISNEICESLYYYKKFDLAIQKCQELLNAEPLNEVVYEPLIQSYVHLGLKKEATYNIIKYFDLSKSTGNLIDWSNNVNRMIHNDFSYYSVIEGIVNHAKIAYKSGELSMASDILSDLSYIDNVFLVDANRLAIEIQKQTDETDETDEILKLYSNLEKSISESIDTLKTSDSKRLEDERLDILFEKANIEFENKKYSQAEHTYYEILGINKFNIEALKSLGEIMEIKDNYIQAKIYYERALQLQSNSPWLEKKIMELENKISQD